MQLGVYAVSTCSKLGQDTPGRYLGLAGTPEKTKGLSRLCELGTPREDCHMFGAGCVAWVC